MTDESCSIVTREVARPSGGRRLPLTSLHLPAVCGDQWSRSGAKRAWWLETDGRASFVRALCQVISQRVESIDQSGPARVVLQVCSLTSERITWPEGVTARRARCDLPLVSAGVFPLTRAEDRAIESVRQRTSPQISAAALKSRLETLLWRTADQRPPMDFATASPIETRQYVRRHFARADLPEVDGFDPFLTAAAVLSGAAHGSPLVLMPSFSQMHLDSPVQAIQAPIAVRRASAPPALEVARRRHQLIVRELSQTCHRTFKCGH